MNYDELKYLKIITHILHKMTFTCKRCGHCTSTKGNLITHLQSKKECPDIKENIPRDDLIAELRNAKSVSRGSVECDCCGKMTSKANFSRHYRICKTKHQHALENLQDEITKLRQEIYGFKGNTNINSNNTNNNTLNISITNFGSESYDHITNDFIKSCIMNNMSGIKQLIEKIHFSEEAPNNKNVRLRSLKNNLVEVADNQKWVVKDANEAMETMIHKGCRLLNGYYQNPDTGIKEYDINDLDMHIQNFLLSIIDKNNKNFFALRRRILALIIDHSDDI